MKISSNIVCLIIMMFGLSFPTITVPRDYPSKSRVKTNTAPIPGPNEYLTDLDNENNRGTGAADGDMDKKLFNNSSVHPIEFNIFVSQDPKSYTATLRISACDVDSNTEPRNPEIDKVYLNNSEVGILQGSNNQCSESLFSISPGILKQGKNQVKVLVDTGNSIPYWDVLVDWGLISLTSQSSISGCKQFNNLPLKNRTVTLKQPGEADRTTTTGADGCYGFDGLVPGKIFSIDISGPQVPRSIRSKSK